MIDYNKLGLSMYENFISDKEHSSIIEEIQSEITRCRGSKYYDRNRVLRYGAKDVCHNNYINTLFPTCLDSISNRLVENKLLKEKPDALNINQYLKNDYIAPHIDRLESGPIITILSLNSVATMLFEHLDNKKEKFEVVMYPKMIMQMRDVIRWRWNHSIYPVKDTRYSIVFRNKNE
jgi:alkylated DNA repair dioxygenase AlkB